VIGAHPHLPVQNCSGILLPEEDKRKFLRKMRNPKIETLQRKAVTKQVIEKCKKMQICQKCGFLNGKHCLFSRSNHDLNQAL
jgi:hypothetical protein